MKTHDIDSITNSTLLAMEKEFRKNDMAPAFHRNHHILRPMIRAQVAILVADYKNNEGKSKVKK